MNSLSLFRAAAVIVIVLENNNIDAKLNRRFSIQLNNIKHNVTAQRGSNQSVLGTNSFVITAPISIVYNISVEWGFKPLSSEQNYTFAEDIGQSNAFISLARLESQDCFMPAHNTIPCTSDVELYNVRPSLAKKCHINVTSGQLVINNPVLKDSGIYLQRFTVGGASKTTQFYLFVNQSENSTDSIFSISNIFAQPPGHFSNYTHTHNTIDFEEDSEEEDCCNNTITTAPPKPAEIAVSGLVNLTIILCSLVFCIIVIISYCTYAYVTRNQLNEDLSEPHIVSYNSSNYSYTNDSVVQDNPES